MKTFCVLILIAAAGFVMAKVQGEAEQNRFTARVDHVVDGDTLKLEGHKPRIRL